jgi:multiple sugar transport system permease protein
MEAVVQAAVGWIKTKGDNFMGYVEAMTGWWSNKRARGRFVEGLLFTSPWLIGAVLFTLYPILASFYYSFTRYSIPKAPVWIGLENYSRLVTDPAITQVLWNSVYLTVIGIPAQLIFALFSAILLNLKIRGQAIWRTIFVLPSLMPAVATTLLWLWILNPKFGVVNNLLSGIGIPGPLWFVSPVWSKPSIILMQMWGVGSTTIIYLAGLQGVPQELYESAEIDGADVWRRFWHITLPMISPVTLFNLVTGVIWSLQFFTQAFIASGGPSTPGKPQGSLLFYGLYLYFQAFTYVRMGYAAALAWILFVITMIVTVIILRGTKQWTYYEVGGRG